MSINGTPRCKKILISFIFYNSCFVRSCKPLNNRSLRSCFIGYCSFLFHAAALLTHTLSFHFYCMIFFLCMLSVNIVIKITNPFLTEWVQNEVLNYPYRSSVGCSELWDIYMHRL